jgi:hypothetical protein
MKVLYAHCTNKRIIGCSQLLPAGCIEINVLKDDAKLFDEERLGSDETWVIYARPVQG